MERVFYGYGIHGGIAQGAVFSPATFTYNTLDYPIKPSEVSTELDRLQSALEKTLQQLSELKDDVKNSLNDVHASIFDVQIALLKDPFIFLQTENYLKKKLKNIEFCLNLVLQNCLKKLSQSMQERCNDLRDVFQRVFFNLCFSSGKSSSIPDNSIFVAKTLYPSDIVFLKKFSVAGIVLEDKCLMSHAIILAKSLNVPIIVGISEINRIMQEGTFLKINGNSGEVILGSKEIYSVNKHPLSSRYFSKTKDGVEVHFWSNYEESVNKEAFPALKVRGVGLVRTELLFLDDQEYPTEEKQFLSYKKIIEKSNPFPVVFRTFDIGGDKSFSFFPKFKETNPFLGTRGIRLCLQYKSLFKQQLCALLRVSALGKIKILYPMVTDAEELSQANQLLEDCKQELRQRGIAFEPSIEIGTMLEIPSTLFILDQLKTQCQFFSVGTNDWVQYILSIDRTNNHLYDKTKMTHPAILKSLRKLFKYSEQLYANVDVCGEMANQFVPFLMTLGIGFRSYTSDMQQIPYLMQLLNRTCIKDLEDLVTEASYCSRRQEIWSLFENYSKKCLQ